MGVFASRMPPVSDDMFDQAFSMLSTKALSKASQTIENGTPSDSCPASSRAKQPGPLAHFFQCAVGAWVDIEDRSEIAEIEHNLDVLGKGAHGKLAALLFHTLRCR